jgi:hypothetical protein
MASMSFVRGKATLPDMPCEYILHRSILTPIVAIIHPETPRVERVKGPD